MNGWDHLKSIKIFRKVCRVETRRVLNKFSGSRSKREYSWLFRMAINTKLTCLYSLPSLLGLLLWPKLCKKQRLKSLLLFFTSSEFPISNLVQQFNSYRFLIFLFNIFFFFPLKNPQGLLLIIFLIFCDLNSIFTSLTLLIALCLLFTYTMATSSSTPQNNKTASRPAPKRGQIKAGILRNLLKAVVSTSNPGAQGRNIGTEAGGSSASPTPPPSAYTSDGSPNITKPRSNIWVTTNMWIELTSLIASPILWIGFSSIS